MLSLVSCTRNQESLPRKLLHRLTLRRHRGVAYLMTGSLELLLLTSLLPSLHPSLRSRAFFLSARSFFLSVLCLGIGCWFGFDFSTRFASRIFNFWTGNQRLPFSPDLCSCQTSLVLFWSSRIYSGSDATNILLSYMGLNGEILPFDLRKSQQLLPS